MSMGLFEHFPYSICQTPFLVHHLEGYGDYCRILEVFSRLSDAYMRGQLRLSFEETAQKSSTKLLGHKTSS